ncbi:MAG TPA: cyanophycin synthetase, partial [Clostridiales bacterium]|nr:cyanophycin synthetase [Clostridiales bacterium]
MSAKPKEDKMEIVSMQIFPGRNIYCHRPVIKMIVDLGGYAVKKTNEIEGFNLKLLQLLPGLSTHFCSLGRAGGFVERLQAGTYPGHVMEHMILELQHMAGNRVIYGKTRLHSEPSIYMIIFEISGESCGMECAKAAAAILDALLKGQPVELKPWLDRICRVTEEEGLGPSTQAIFQAAKKAGIPVMRLGEDSLLQLGYGKYSRLVQATLTDAVRSITTDVVSDKQLTKRMLASHDLPVPRGDIVRTLEEAEAAAEEIGYPVVLKPHNGNQGKGVTLNICSREHLKKAWDIAEAFSSKVLVEQYVRGRDYRVLVVGDKVSAAAERTPPGIFGDGKHTIAELVQLENQNVLRGKGHEKPLTRIPLDEVALEELNRQGFDQNSVPAAGRLVRLRGNGNLSTGGTARDCTLEIHPDNAAMAVSAAKIMGLDIAGIDMVSADIAKPLQDNHGVIVEVNAAPGLRMHLHPTEGDPRDVAGDIVRILFPEGRYHTIPIISVTGTNGKTTTTRMIGHILESAGFHVGMTTTGGIYIGGVCKVYGDNTGPASARMVLSDRTVEAAVLETARGGIIQKGLGYDMADVGV